MKTLFEDIQKCTEDRVRWDHLDHLYINTTPDSLIFSYKELNPNKDLEINLISLLKPINFGSNEQFYLDSISPRFKKYAHSNIIDMKTVPVDFFYGRLVSVINDPSIDEYKLKKLTQRFDDYKGFTLNTGIIFISFLICR